MQKGLAFIAIAVTTGGALQAHAGTVTVQNTTDVVSYISGTSGGPTDYFDNGTSAVGPSNIGGNFGTSQLAFTSTALSNGTYSIGLQYTTLFSGSETINDQAIYYPDIFLRTAGVGYSSQGFNYAISLGTETANGGLAAGFYAVGTDLTSQKLWAPRNPDGSPITYGGQYTKSTAYQPGQAGFRGYNAPVVLTSGTKLAGATVTDGTSGSLYTVSVNLTLTAAEAAGFIDGADVFWGTGDCANGAFLASIPANGSGGPTGGPVPEPAALLIFAVGLGSIAMVKKQRWI